MCHDIKGVSEEKKQRRKLSNGLQRFMDGETKYRLAKEMDLIGLET